MLVTSRSFEEYAAFSALEPAALPGRILDACAGASDFVARAGGRGAHAVAVDPAYALASADFDAAVSGSAGGGAQLIAAHEEHFTYAWYGTPERRARMRSTALEHFREDRRRAPGRYVAAGLPRLPFASSAFDLALCSHLLFTWADRFDEA